MTDVRIPEALWRGAMAPCGQIVRWRVENGGAVQAGAPVAEVLIEEAAHEILSPVSGRFWIADGAGAVVQPGDVIGYVKP